MAPLTFSIPAPPAKSFTVRRDGDHVELVPTTPIRHNGGTILAFCLPIDEARALAADLRANADAAEERLHAPEKE